MRRLAAFNPVYLVLALLIAAIAWQNPAFVEPQGYMNFLKRAAPLAVLAMGQLFVVVAGGFDLSVGAVITFTVVGSSMLLGADPDGTWWVVLTMYAAGFLVGTVNGAVVCFLKVPSLIATLGTMITVGGAAIMWSGGAPRGYLPDAFRMWGRQNLADVPVVRILPLAVVLLVAVALVLWWLMHRTNFGRMVHALGDNPRAARLAGVPVNRVRIAAFVVSSLSAVTTGVLLGGFAGVSTNVGDGWELQAITATVIGGAALLGGRGSIPATVAGALTLTAIFTLLNFLGLPQPVRQVVQGVILVAAVAVAVGRRRATGA